VRIDSRNPSLVPGAPGEGAAAHLLASVLREWGFRVELAAVVPGRPNVVARAGRPGGRSLMFNGHLDVVGVEGMRHAPFEGNRDGDYLYGRGSCDMKGGVAAMCAAAARAVDAGLEGEVVVAAVVDEEFESKGTRALVARGIRADAAVVTEPTGLQIHPAHRGFSWVRLEFRGRAAHGSRYDLGVDAIQHAGLVLEELRQLQRDVLDARSHPLLGHASLHASTVAGGLGWSTYPDACVLTVERRTLPGETEEGVLGEFLAACGRAKERDERVEVTCAHVFSQRPSDVPTDAPIVRALAEAIEEEGDPVTVGGMTAWTDAALLNEGGIPAICYGPGDIVLAHAAEEWIPVDEVERAARVLCRLALRWGRDGSA
jgi:acetylornithine deacetylase